jgi:hypothetical protein
MRKAFKYISIYFMWLAVVTIWAHMIIPHDHHILETFSDQEQNCPASHHQSGDKSEFPVHCHAFNDLASEKARSFHISRNITDGFAALIIIPDNLISEPQIAASGITDFQTHVLSSFLDKAALLRAPPSLA